MKSKRIIKSRKSRKSKRGRRTRKIGGSNGSTSNEQKRARQFLCNSKLEQILDLEERIKNTNQNKKIEVEKEIERLKKESLHCKPVSNISEVKSYPRQISL